MHGEAITGRRAPTYEAGWDSAAASDCGAGCASRSRLVRRTAGFRKATATTPTTAMTAEIRKMWPVASP